MGKQLKNILITGVSRGLGKILSEYLIKQGSFVYGTVRDPSGFKDRENIKYIHLDLEDNRTIDSAVEYLFSQTDTIDGIIHNAGVAYLSPADVMKDSERRRVFDVNFFGPLYLTELILPKLRKAHQGRIIYISSIASVDPWPSLGVYSASKAAFERVAFEWAVLLKRWNIYVSIIRPNPLPTNMQILKSERNHLDDIYGDVFVNDLEWEKTEDVCARVQEILDSASPPFESTTGKISHNTVHSLIQKDSYQTLLEKYSTKLDKQIRKNSRH